MADTLETLAVKARCTYFCVVDENKHISQISQIKADVLNLHA
jgi:hypothetical protein